MRKMYLGCFRCITETGPTHSLASDSQISPSILKPLYIYVFSNSLMICFDRSTSLWCHFPWLYETAEFKREQTHLMYQAALPFEDCCSAHYRQAPCWRVVGSFDDCGFFLLWHIKVSGERLAISVRQRKVLLFPSVCCCLLCLREGDVRSTRLWQAVATYQAARIDPGMWLRKCNEGKGDDAVGFVSWCVRKPRKERMCFKEFWKEVILPTFCALWCLRDSALVKLFICRFIAQTIRSNGNVSNSFLAY